MTSALRRITESGVSIWLDDLSRERFDPSSPSSLQALVTNRDVVGVTTNPAIFSASISNSEVYNDDLVRLTAQGLSPAQSIRALTVADVQQASDLLHDIYRGSGGKDGRISIEVDPEFARDTVATIQEGLQLWKQVARPNILVKVPATREGLPAITELTRQGISVNVTLIFTAKRYDAVIDAYFEGLRKRLEEGGTIEDIHSVASFFVSRIDTEFDARLKEMVDPASFDGLRGKTGIANALTAYQLFLERFSSSRWHSLQDAGANLQRPLWASTGVKDPDYPATLYVESLITGDSVNTMPENTLQAVAALPSDHPLDPIALGSPQLTEAKAHLQRVAELGLEIDVIGEKLEEEGLEKFITPWRSLHRCVEAKVSA